MEKYIEQLQGQEISYTEPQDEYICSSCRKKVGLVIDGKCIDCSNSIENTKH